MPTYFVTGASGFIGSRVVKLLLAEGHQVLGLAHHDGAAEKLKTLGATPHPGSLKDLDALKAGAAQADGGVIHLGFIHDFSDFAGSCATDEAAIKAMFSVLEGTDKVFVGTNGLLAGAGHAVYTERDAPLLPTPRNVNERLVLDAASRGVRSIVIRLPPAVHGPNDHGFTPQIIASARKAGFAGYCANHWPSAHVDDAAALYVLAATGDTPAGTALHGAAENVLFGDIARAIGRGLGLEARAITSDEADAHFGWLAFFAKLDNVASSDFTRELTGWVPKGKTLIEDLQEGDYFA